MCAKVGSTQIKPISPCEAAQASELISLGFRDLEGRSLDAETLLPSLPFRAFPEGINIPPLTLFSTWRAMVTPSRFL